MHEWGHCKTGATHSVSSPFELVGKNEERANRTAIKQFVPFCEIKKAVNNGFAEYWQLAEYFNLDEKQLIITLMFADIYYKNVQQHKQKNRPRCYSTKSDYISGLSKR